MTESHDEFEKQESLLERSPYKRLWFSCAFAAVLVAVDFFSGPDTIVPGYFVLPAMLMAWNCGTRPAVVLSAILSVIHFSFLLQAGTPMAVAVVLNAVMRSGVLVTLAIVTARLGRRTRAMRERVQILEGILPTCSYCKDIRDEDGEWEPIESYVSRRSEAQFSHGICPDCAQKHFGVSLASKAAV